MTTNKIKRSEGAEVAQSAGVAPVYAPDVDVIETAEAIMLAVDLPGVEIGAVEVRAENGLLTIEGTPRRDPPAGYTQAACEFSVGKFRRTFQVGETVQAEAAKARMRGGVLELTLPKREEAKPRRIEITA